MAIADDFSVAVAGDIRYTGDGSTTYTVLEFRNYLGALLDDAQGSGDDLADITTETIYDRSTDQILTLNSPFNIDETAAEHLYDGSITQNGGDDVYSGLYVVGAVVAGTEPMIVQNNKVLTPYWGTGLNPDATAQVIMKIMVKSREGGADIDNQKVRVMAREFNDAYAEFDVTLGQANSTAAIFTGDDLNNDTVSATVEGYSSIVNTEGFQELDIDGTGATGQEYYSQWDIGTETLPRTYERTKWIQKRAELADSNAETLNDFTVDDATITGIGAEFSARDNTQELVEARFRLKISGTPTGNMYCELHLSDDSTPGIPTGGVLATSEVKDVNRLTTAYQEVVFRFTDNVSMTANEDYFIVLQHPDGAVADYIIAEGDATSADDGTRAHNTAGWTGVSGEQLWFEVKSCPLIHTMAGELFRGITHEILWDGPIGAGVAEDDEVFWGTRVTYDGESGAFEVGRYVKIGALATPTVAKNGGKILYDDTVGNVLYLALEDSSGAGAGQLANDDVITQIGGTAASADATATIVDDDKAGGTGMVLAEDDNTTDGEIYIQLLSGAAPVDGLRINASDVNYVVVNTAPNVKTISPAFVGQSTGSNIIGAYGIGFDPNDVGSNDTFFDLGTTQRTPQNKPIFTVDGLVSGEDYILVGPRAAGVLDKNQYTLEITLTANPETIVKVNPDIQTETPEVGTGNTKIRVQMDNGIYRKQIYNTWGAVADEFAIPNTDYSGGNIATAGNDVFVAYIDVLADATTEAFQAVHVGDRDLLIRVRDGGTAGDNEPIKTIESPASFTSASQTVTITRTSDA